LNDLLASFGIGDDEIDFDVICHLNERAVLFFQDQVVQDNGVAGAFDMFAGFNEPFVRFDAFLYLDPQHLAGKEGEDVDRKAMNLLERVGLLKRMDHFPDKLSGGQQQRVAIARALVNDPKIIVADEPTGNLDSQTGREIIDLFKELAGKGTAVLMVTHDIILANSSQRTYLLRDGILHSSIDKEVL